MENIQCDENEQIGYSSEKKPLELLPELEPLEGVISLVRYQQVVFLGVPQFLTNQDTKENILDKSGNKIPKKEFHITVDLKGFDLSNGKPRNVWIQLGASLGEKAKLPKFLANLGISVGKDSKAKDIIDALTGVSIKLQVVNKIKEDKSISQKVVIETVRASSKKKETKQSSIADLDAVQWEE